MPGGQTFSDGGRPLGFDADDPHLRPLLLDGDRNARDQAASAHRNDHGANVGHGLEDLEADRSLPGRDRRIVERVHQVHLPCLLLRLEALLPVRQRRQHDLGAIAANRLELAHRCVFPDDDHARRPHDVGRVCQRHAVIPGRQCDDAAATLLRAQLEDGIDSAPHLEGAGPLQVLRLQPGAGAGDRLVGEGWGLPYVGMDPVGRGLDVGQGQGTGFDRHP